MTTLSLLRLVSKSVLAFSLSVPALAHAGQTPFGFEIGKSVASQIPSCSEETSRMCVERLEAEDIEVYKLRGEKNILGGRQQQVFVLQKEGSIEQVQILFKSSDLLFVNSLLAELFGEPSLVTKSKEWDGGSEQESHAKHWVAEDGVISLQDQTAVEGASVAFIRTHEDFKRTLEGVSHTESNVQLQL